MTGQGKALVCCVGKNTLLAQSRQPDDLVVQEQKTFLESKLDAINKHYGIEVEKQEARYVVKEQ